MASKPRPFVGLVAGMAAGLVASAAMAAFRSGTTRLLHHDAHGEAEILPAEPSPEPQGHAVQYVAGAVLGGIYGLITEYRPEARAGFGSAYGMATSTLLEEATPSDDGSVEADAVGTASHLVYGAVLEGVRWLLAGRR